MLPNEDASSSAYHESVPAEGGHEDAGESWEENPAPLIPTEQPTINMIWAEAYSGSGVAGAIGNNGGIPWHLKEDLKHFQALTVSHPVIMGRKTWENLPDKSRPLPDRDNIVLSYDDDYEAPGATVVDSIDEAISIAKIQSIPEDGINRSEIWIIGGASVFRQCMGIADQAIVTQIDVHVDADTFAPDMAAYVSKGEWRRAHVGQWIPVNDRGGIRRYRFVRYVRKEKHGWSLFHHDDDRD
jgi:dihydrofolate reductase